jgi:hypothetical protein
MNNHRYNDVRGAEAHGRFEGLEDLDAELLALDAQLSRLGSIDRDAIPAGLADRISAGTAGDLAASKHGVIGRIFPASVPVWSLRIAAMLGLAAAVGFAWVSTRTNTTGSSGRGPGITVASAASVEQDVESWLTITNATESELAQLSIDSQDIDAGTISDPGTDSWILDGEPL